jgi:hypothetical protein
VDQETSEQVLLLASIPGLVHIVGGTAFTVTTHTHFIAKLFPFLFDYVKKSLCLNDMTSVYIVALKKSGDFAALAITPA